MLIIDAFNVLHTDGVLPAHLANPGVPGLVRLLAKSRYAARDITLVCDGGASTTDSGIRMEPVRVLYSGGGREADDLIEDLIEHYHRGNALEIVSSDKRLKRAARKKKARCIESAVFLAELSADASRTPTARGNGMRAQVPLDPYSVAAWFEEFGLEPPRAPAKQPGPLPKPVPNPQPVPRAGTRSRPTPRNKPNGASPSGLGERLKIDLTPPSTVGSPPPLAPDPMPAPTGRPETVSPPPRADQSPPDLSRADPLLIEALEEWRDRLSLDDLCMQQWVPDATPLPRRKTKQPPRLP